MEEDQISNVFTVASSPSSKGKISSISNISKKLFDDNDDQFQQNY